MSKVEALGAFQHQLAIQLLSPAARRAIEDASKAMAGLQPADAERGLQSRMQSRPTEHLADLQRRVASLSPAFWSEQHGHLVKAGWSSAEADQIVAGARKAAATIELQAGEMVL